jgi:hypothetical protein
MAPSLAELLHDWHDFYVLVGTASATLVGLMFIAVSIGTSIFNEDRRVGMTAFITPTVVHFGATLFTCLLITVPTQSWYTLGALLAAGRARRLDLLWKSRCLDHRSGTRGFERQVVLRAPSSFWIYARARVGGAVAHAVHRRPQPHRPRGAHLDCFLPPSQRLGHDGLDRHQDAPLGLARLM